MKRIILLAAAVLALHGCGPSSVDVLDDQTASAAQASPESLIDESYGKPEPVEAKIQDKAIPEERVENSEQVSSLDPALAEEVVASPARSKPRYRLPTPAVLPIPTSENNSEFSCSMPKTCPMMRSCEEAKYHLNQCGDSARDRDGDGVPCENIC